jgi:hypothetical protein
VNVGTGIFQDAAGKSYLNLAFQAETISVQVTLTSQDHAEHDLTEMITTLEKVREDFRRINSGIVVSDCAMRSLSRIKPTG